MKTLFLIRHAKSSWADVGARDIDRSLNERGHKDAPEMAKLLHGLGIKLDLIVSSPAKRALMTATYFATAFDKTIQDITLEKEIYEASEKDIQNVIHELPDWANTILLFGHNPTFTNFANHYTKDHIDNIPTCGIVRYDLKADKWADFKGETVKVNGFWYPKMPSY